MTNYRIAILLTLSFFFISQLAWAQNKVKIHGELSSEYSDQALIYIVYSDTNSESENVDSMRLEGSQFLKDIIISDPTNIVMAISPKGKSLNSMTDEEKGELEAIEFFVDRGDVFLKSDGSFAKLKPDPVVEINEDYKSYRTLLAQAEKNLNQIQERYSPYITEVDGQLTIQDSMADAYNNEVKNQQKLNANVFFDFAKENRQSYVGLAVLKDCFFYHGVPAAELLEVYHTYPSSLHATVLGKMLKEELELAIKNERSATEQR